MTGGPAAPVLRILYLADIRFPLERANGIQTMEMCHALAERGHLVTLLVRPDTHCPRRDPLGFYGLPALPTLTIDHTPHIASPGRRRIAYVARAVSRGLVTGRPDVVLTRDLGIADLLILVPRAARPPVVYESHGFAPVLSDLLAEGRRPSSRKLKRLTGRERRVWRHADGYVATTQVLAGELGERFGPRPAPALVLPNGVRLPPARAFAPPTRRPNPVAAYAGHLYRWKGVELLLEALMLLPDVRGLIVGGNEEDVLRVRARAEALGLSDRVRFTGLVPRTHVPLLLASADVLVLPTTGTARAHHYSSALKLFEYAAAGKPIIASDLPSFRELLGEDRAMLVEPGSAATLASGIRRVLDDPTLAERLARRAFDHAEQFSWSRRAARLETLLISVAGPTPREAS